MLHECIYVCQWNYYSAAVICAGMSVVDAISDVKLAGTSTCRREDVSLHASCPWNQNKQTADLVHISLATYTAPERYGQCKILYL